MAQALRTKDRSAFVPGQVLRVYGMRRSGNHALINWIMRNTENGHGVFLNDCRHGADPVSSAKAVSLFERGEEVDVQGRGQKLRQAGLMPFAVVSYEDRAPPRDANPLFAAPERMVLIYRSFLNWAASLLRKIQGNTGFGPLDRNRIMGRALSTYSDMLDRLPDPSLVSLCYDQWTADEHYREEALSRLGLPGRDLALGAVQRYGGGSSFQNTKSAETLNTDQRSAHMADDLEYQLLLWTAARDDGFLTKLAGVFPKDADRLRALRQAASAQVVLP